MLGSILTDGLSQTLAKIAVLGVGFAFSAVAQHTPVQSKHHIAAQTQAVSQDDCILTRIIQTVQSSAGSADEHIKVEKLYPTMPRQTR